MVLRFGASYKDFLHPGQKPEPCPFWPPSWPIQTSPRRSQWFEQIASLERLGDEYRKATGKEVSEDVLLTTLAKVLPAQLRQHVQLSMTETSIFCDVKEKILAYEKVSTSWSRDRVLQECGATALGSVTSHASEDAGPVAMEVNVFSKGKGKKGKGGDKGKGKQKGFNDKGKGKGKSADKGKGKGQSAPKGQQKGYTNHGFNGGQQQKKKKFDANVCAYCGKQGHWQRGCRKGQSDMQQQQQRRRRQQQQQQVRVVRAGDNVDTRQDTQSTTAGFSTGSESQAVRLVSMQCAHVGPHVVEDLTIHSCPMSPTNPGKVSILKQCDAFDMSVTDSDDAWTYSPYCTQHVRAVSSVDKDGGFTCETFPWPKSVWNVHFRFVRVAHQLHHNYMSA